MSLLPTGFAQDVTIQSHAPHVPAPAPAWYSTVEPAVKREVRDDDLTKQGAAMPSASDFEKLGVFYLGRRYD